MRPTIIAVTGYKGGVAKTTTVMHLARFLSDKGHTLVIDGDVNQAALGWSERGALLPFEVAGEAQAANIIRNYQYVVIDTAGRPEKRDFGALAKRADLIVLPTIPSGMSVGPTLEAAKALNDAPKKLLMVLVPPYPSTDGETWQAELKRRGYPVFRSMIHRRIIFSHAADAGITVDQYPPSAGGEAWQDYEDLGKEILKELK